ncbi:hypothetical protein LAG90_08625 [Marinilongibacter aquaticus]|uniref:hypothetical protein n=1 Tax=Marinilongibacter aquaticus TaxID=2975157 RepID=UPI0021BDBD0A|nr:hypothetical protein [Marinilongibacter aquaticus]UBM60699.1 hypothetical protein LAG90_08625 [Marinilongibacter aquaticus]
MRALYLIIWILFGSRSLNAQVTTVSEFLQGIWSLEFRSETSDFYQIYSNNVVYKVFLDSEENAQMYPLYSFCIPKVPIYHLDSAFNRLYIDSIKADEVVLDKKFITNDEGFEEICILHYDSSSIVNENVILLDRSELGDEYFISYYDLDNFYIWDGGAANGIVYYNRIVNPPKDLYEIYKEIAANRFKRVVRETNLYPEPKDKRRAMEILKVDEEIEVISSYGDWLRVRRYYEQNHQGWIRKEDVE